MDETTGIGTKSGMNTAIGDGEVVAWVVVEVRRRACAEEGCSPAMDGVRTRTIGGVVVIGSVTTNGIVTTATIGMHPPGATTGITEIGTGVVTARTRISEDIPLEEDPTITDHPAEEAGVAPVTIPPETVVPIVTELPEDPEETLWTIGTVVADAEDQVGEVAEITTVEGNRLRRPTLKHLPSERLLYRIEYSESCVVQYRVAEQRESKTKSNLLAALPVREVCSTFGFKLCAFLTY